MYRDLNNANLIKDTFLGDTRVRLTGCVPKNAAGELTSCLLGWGLSGLGEVNLLYNF